MHMIGRREFLLAGGATAAVAALGTGIPLSVAEDDAGGGRSPQFAWAYRNVVGEAVPEEAYVTLDLPEIAENGNTVPYKLEVESPMTEADYVKNLHLLSTANPQPAVATFHFTPQSGKATVAGRMRLAKTQDVVAIAETNGGKLFIGKRNVNVVIGGCGNE